MAGARLRFREKLRFADDAGNVTHAEMTIGDGSVFMGDPGDEYRCPKNGGGWPAQIHVYIDDVDAHYAQAQAAGAEIRLELHDTEYGDRRYDAYDREGHLVVCNARARCARFRVGGREGVAPWASSLPRGLRSPARLRPLAPNIAFEPRRRLHDREQTGVRDARAR